MKKLPRGYGDGHGFGYGNGNGNGNGYGNGYGNGTYPSAVAISCQKAAVTNNHKED